MDRGSYLADPGKSIIVCGKDDKDTYSPEQVPVPWARLKSLPETRDLHSSESSLNPSPAQKPADPGLDQDGRLGFLTLGLNIQKSNKKTGFDISRK